MKQTITFPRVGIYTNLFKELVEKLGAEVMLPPPITQKTIKLGVRHSSDFMCFPFKVCLGNLIETLEIAKKENIRLTHLGVGYSNLDKGACRFHHYFEIQKRILEDLGYNLDMVLIERKNIFKFMKRINPKNNYIKIFKLFWQFYKQVRQLEKQHYVFDWADSEKVRIGIVGEWYCYSEDTEILTENGWKLFKNLKPKEKVVQVNKKLEMSLIEPNGTLDGIYAFDYDGDLINFKSQQIDLLVTPNHRMLYKSSNGFLKVKEAQNIKSGIKLFKCGKWIDGNDIKPKKFGNITMSPLQYVRFMGIWLSEGCVTKWYDKKGKRERKWIMIFQENKKIAEEIKQLLKDIGFNIDYNKQEMFRITNNELFDYLVKFGKSYDKFVPKEILNAKKEYLYEFLKWFCYGDGGTIKSISKTIRYAWQNNKAISRTRVFYSNNKRLIGEIQAILIKLNKQGNIIQNKCNKEYTIYEQKTPYCRIDKRHIRKQKYKGKVYCVNVNNGFIIVRRNGKSCVSGNTCLEGAINYDMYTKLKHMDVNVHQAPCATLSGFLKHQVHLEDTPKKYIKMGKKYYGGFLQAHARYSLWNMFYYKENKFDGVIHLMPLSCMPESTVEMLMDLVSKELDLPVYHFPIDEEVFQTGTDMRIKSIIRIMERNKQ